MSAFDVKKLTEQDASRLEQAKKEEAASIQSEAANGNPLGGFDPENSPVAEVVEQIMSHWADDDTFTQEATESSGDDREQRQASGEGKNADLRDGEGMSADFNPDAAGPTEGIEVPPKADGGEFGGGGGGGGDGGSGDAADMPGSLDDGGAGGGGDDMPDFSGDLPGFSMDGAEGEAVYGGGGGGGKPGKPDDDKPRPPNGPPDPKKPKKP